MLNIWIIKIIQVQLWTTVKESECMSVCERGREREIEKKEEGMENQSICDSLKLAQFGLVLIT